MFCSSAFKVFLQSAMLGCQKTAFVCRWLHGFDSRIVATFLPRLSIELV